MVFSIIELGVLLAIYLPCLVIAVGGLALLQPFIVPVAVAEAIGPGALTILTLLLGMGLAALLSWGAIGLIGRLRAWRAGDQ